MPERKIISIIIPVYNEQENILLLCDRLGNVCRGLKTAYNFEFIFIDDGSSDQSQNLLEDLAKVNNRVKLIQFSRNFGKEIAVSAGIYEARGEAVIMIDADLQHPPELLGQFLDKWEQGAEIVIGIREKNKNEGLVKKFGSFCFYKIMNAIGETKIIPRATDYRLLDRKVVNEFNRFTERNRISRGLIDWLGFEKDFIYFQADERQNGKAKYGFLKLVKLALSSFVTHSLFPLKLAGYLGVIITGASGFFGLFIIIEAYILADPWGLDFSGPFLVGVLLLFMVGIILSCLGLVALYVASIHSEVVNRPLYVIRKKKNF